MDSEKEAKIDTSAKRDDEDQWEGDGWDNEDDWGDMNVRDLRVFCFLARFVLCFFFFQFRLWSPLIFQENAIINLKVSNIK